MSNPVETRGPRPSAFRRRLAAAVRFLLAFRGGKDGPLAWSRAVAVASAGLVVGLLLTPGALAVPTSLGRWGMMAAISVETAINAVAFDLPSHVDQRVCRWFDSANDPTLTFDDTWGLLDGTVNERLRLDPAIGDRRLLDLPALTAGSAAAHAALQAPYAQNEPSSAWIVELLLRVHPGLTLPGALAALNALRLLWLWMFALALLRGGASPALAWAALFIGLRLLRESLEVPPLACGYASLLPALLGAVGGLALMVSARVCRHPWAGPASFFVVGAGAVFLANLRTSYVPIIGALLATILLVGALDLRRCKELTMGRRCRLWAVNALALLLGATALDRAAFAPARQVPTSLNEHYHVVAHSLVLSLALPPNPLSKSEGILWNDYRGIALARREDPTVRFLRSGYEAALFSYYRRLWRERTGDMLATYATKFGVAGAAALEHCRSAYPGRSPGAVLIRCGTLPLAWLRHGALFAGLAIATIALAWWCWRRAALSDEGGWLLAALAGTALLCYLEAALIVSIHDVAYHGMLVFFVAFVGISAQALGLDVLRRWSQRR